MVPRLSLIRASQPTEPRATVYEPALCIVAQGRKRAMLGATIFDYDPAKYLVVSVDLPIVGQVVEASEAEPFLCFRLELDVPALAALLLEMPRDAGSGDSAGLAVNAITPDLLDPVIRLMRLLERPADIPILAPLAEREILYRLLLCEQGALLRQIALADSRLSQINRAIGWIKRNYAAPFRIETVAREANMSPSSLHHHFKAVTAMSPLQYQKQVRLQEARRLILAERADAATAGFAVGYESPSQFSREYRRLFGAPPVRDAARLRMSSELAFSVA
ncbi:AraC family transcriptional regulator [Sphingomonas oleivorans]|uniref:AraC family transcriptional regulator n=1 Tax=Sphingomonas oleivorans TaxID=1735121 RepID=UPI00311A9610